MPTNEFFTASIYSEGSSLTAEKLLAMVEQLPEVKFSAVTCAPAIFEKLRNHPEINNEVSIMRGRLRVWTFSDLNVYPVQKQLMDCIEWRDKNSLEMYLEMMGEAVITQTERFDRLDALERIAQIARMEFGDVVLNTMNIPTEFLRECLALIRPPDILLAQCSEHLQKLSDELKKLSAPAFDPLEFRNDKPEGKEPFYKKFTVKPRRKNR